MIGLFGGATSLMNAGASAPVEASGGTTGTYTDPNGDWKYHKWQNGDPAPSMTFVVTAGGEVEWLVVGGGGGGGASKSGFAFGKGRRRFRFCSNYGCYTQSTYIYN